MKTRTPDHIVKTVSEKLAETLELIKGAGFFAFEVIMANDNECVIHIVDRQPRS